MRFCRRIGAEPCICVNTITGTPSEAFHWLEYCNFDGDSTYARLRGQNGHPEPYNVKYWKLGNEPEISARAYATQVMPFANALRRAGKHLPIELVTGVTAKNKIEWTRGLLAALKEGLSHEFDPPIDHLSLHHYALAGGSLIDFSDEQYYELLASRHRLERRIQLIIGIADQAWGRSKKLGLFIGEWGRVGNPGEQMYTQFNTFREAMLAAVYLDTFHKYADRVRMANVSHMINVGSCLIYANEETMFLTPNYYVWEMYKPHKGATSLQILAESPIIKEKALRRLVDHETKRDLRALSASASMNPETRTLTVTFVNQSLTNDMELDIEARDTGSLGDATLTVLVSDDVRDINTFTNPHSVKPPQSGTRQGAGQEHQGEGSGSFHQCADR